MANRRKKQIHGTAERPRLVVFRSLKYIYGQIIDDAQNKVLMSMSNLTKDMQATVKKAKTKTDASFVIGEALAKMAVDKKIKNIIFDRNGYVYHGRIKAFAEGARKGGLKF